jgi:hypothetical protein
VGCCLEKLETLEKDLDEKIRERAGGRKGRVNGTEAPTPTKFG